MDSKFPQRLRELRSEKGLTQEELGALVDISKMGISHWENGKSQPDLARLLKLAEIFDISVDYLVGKSDY